MILLQDSVPNIFLAPIIIVILQLLINSAQLTVVLFMIFQLDDDVKVITQFSRTILGVLNFDLLPD